MPTKTKPKTPSWSENSWPVVTVTDYDLDILYYTVDIDPAINPDMARKFAKDVEGLINRRIYKLVCAMHNPVPAHVVAALAPIHAHAVALAALLDCSSLSGEVQKALDMPQIDDGTAWDLFTQIGIACQIAMTSLKDQSRSGLHNKRYSEAVHYATELFIDFFEKTRGPSPDQPDDAVSSLSAKREYDADKKEFLTLCLSYLPDVATIAKAGTGNSRNK